MTKGEFVKAVVERSETELTVKDAEKIVEVVFREMGRAVSGKGRFVWPGFGTFTVRDRAARQGRNPRTGETNAGCRDQDGGVQAGAGAEGQSVTGAGRCGERGTTEGRAARYTNLRRGTSEASSAPLAGARSARQGSRRAGFGRCGATARQRAEAVRRKRNTGH